MIIDITYLKARTSKFIEFDETITFPKEKLQEADLLDLKDVRISGMIQRNPLDTFDIKIDVTGTMVLACAITLKPVEHHFELSLEEDLEELLNEIDENHEPLGNKLDILPIVWSNILMEVPMRVVCPDAKLEDVSGEGWKVIDDVEDDIINPALEKLKDLL